MNWAEQLGGLVLVFAGIALVGGIGFALQKRNETGSFRPSGPNPMTSTWVHSDRAWLLFKNGAAVHRGEVSISSALRLGSSRELWEESVKLGNLDAYTALGMLEHEDDRIESAKRIWQEAAAAGNVPASMCLHSLRDQSGVAYDKVSDAILAAASGRAYALEQLAALSYRYGTIDYAVLLEARAAPVDKPYWPGVR